MSIELYKKAVHAGERAYQEALSKGEYPYLQVLEEIISHVNIVSEVNLGLNEIPAEAIKGTYAAGRRTAFAPNFMPLLPARTEFGEKWSVLADAHLNEGIQNPVKVFEYMHHFYVMEGNKRVSVLKFFGAPTIPGNVTRLIPQRTDAKENRVYFEYLEFYKVCPVLYLVLTEPGAYSEFLTFAGKKPGERFTENELMDLRSLYVRFEKALRSLGEERLKKITTGDALLTYLHFFDYRTAVLDPPEVFYDRILTIREELYMLTERESVELVLSPEDVPKPGVFGRMLSGLSDRKLRIAFIYRKTPETSSWTYGHELGRLAILDEFGDRVETFTRSNIGPGEIDACLEELLLEEPDMIFATSQLYLDSCVRFAALHPSVKILYCGVNTARRYIRTYYGRSYEAKYLSGLIAGAMTKTPDIGYLSDIPFAPSLIDLNAFALGVQAVNPAAKVHVIFRSQIGADPDSYLTSHHISMVSGGDIHLNDDFHREFGLYMLKEDGIQNLAVTLLNWGVFYRRLIDSVLDGSFDEVERISENRAVNYWWGFGADVIDLLVSRNIPDSTRNLVEFMKNSLRNGSFLPFSGRITGKTGAITTDENAVLSPMEIATMDWLNNNIIGDIPDPSLLTPEARRFMEIQGEKI